MIDPYSLLKTLHIISSTVLFGTGIGTAFQMWRAHLSGDVRLIAGVTRSVVAADWLFTLPSALFQPASGVALVVLAGFDPMASWLVAAYVLYGVAGACWLYVVWLQLRVRDLAQDALQHGRPLPPDYFGHMRTWFALGWPAFVALSVVFWLMAAKPALW
jgi:uncharacterized membrane protein